jgi:outer membrane protein assembly factor BamB
MSRLAKIAWVQKQTAGVALALLGACALSAGASDWPQYKRDAARTADAADESLAFPLQRVMAMKFPAPIYASAAVVGGKVYAVDQRGLLACVDAVAHRVLWKAEIGGVANSSSPAVAGGKVFVGSTAGYLLVLDASTGKEVVKVPAEGGVIAAPAVTNDAVYCLTFNGKMLKVDLSGKLVWTYDGGKSANGEFAVQGKSLIFWDGPVDERGAAEPYGLHVVEDLGHHAERKQLLRRADLEGEKIKFGPTPAGSELGLFQRGGWWPAFGVTRRGPDYLFRDVGVLFWGGPTGHRAAAPGSMSQPVLTKDHVVVGDADGRISFYNLVPEKGFAGKPVSSNETSRVGKPNGGISATPAVSGGVVYVGGEDGILYGWGPGKQAEIVSVLPPGTPGQGPRPGEKLTGPEWPTVGGDMTYAGLSPDRNLKPPLKIEWKTRIAGSGGQNSVVVARGAVFVVSFNGMVESLDAATGEILWRTYHPAVHRSGYGDDGPPTYADGKLLVLRRATNPASAGLWCHDARTGEVLWRKPTPVLITAGGAPQGDGLVVHEGKVLTAWQDGSNAVETAALELGTGKDVWRVRHEGIIPPTPADAKTVAVRVCQGALGDKTWFISACVNRENGEGKYVGGATLAIDPADGKLLWKNTERSIGGFGGVNCRKGVVVVNHTGTLAHALDAKTGNPLWSSKWRQGAPWHLMPLTDDYLDSQSRKGAFGGYCTDSVWVNGVWYGPPGCASHVLCAHNAAGSELWRYVVISRGCPAPAPAYGRLYYAGFGEGVVYCFTNREPTLTVQHEGLGKAVQLARPFVPQYPGPAGGKGLTDGLRASGPEYLNPQWHGLGTNLEVVVDMDTAARIRTVSSGFLNQTAVGVFAPAAVEYAVSADGKDFRVAATVTNDLSAEGLDRIKEFTAADLNLDARYIRLRATRQKQERQSLFIDEIVVNPLPARPPGKTEAAKPAAR